MGQDAIEFVACALGVPLYRKVISGAALEQGLEYGTRNAKAGGVLGDETEDLYTLLLTVKVRFLPLTKHLLDFFSTAVTAPRHSRRFSWCYPLELSESACGTCVSRKRQSL